MKAAKNIRPIFVKVILAMLLLLCCFGETGAAAQISVIAHKAVPAESLEQSELYQLFTGNQEYWNAEIKVVIVDLALNGEIRDSFYDYLGKTSSRMRSIWLKRKLTGEGDLPISVESEALLLKKVAETPGAIGFLSAAAVNGQEEIKVLIPAIPILEN